MNVSKKLKLSNDSHKRLQKKNMYGPKPYKVYYHRIIIGAQESMGKIIPLKKRKLIYNEVLKGKGNVSIPYIKKLCEREVK